MKKLFPLILAMIGTGAGVGAGIMLKSDEPEIAISSPCGETKDAESHKAFEKPENAIDSTAEFVKLGNQFVIPIVAHDRVASLVVMSLSVEVPAGQRDLVYERAPKLRDALLQQMFDHANIGGFEGEFTNSSQLDVLRESLLEASRRAMGDTIQNVLITDIARQDI